MSTQTIMPATGKVVAAKPYASVMRRFVALCFDLAFFTLTFFLLFVPLLLIASLFSFLMSPFAIPFVGFLLPWAVYLAASWIYFAAFESSAKGATPGKRLMGLRVTDLDGVRLSFRRASVRHLGKIISATPLMLGFVLALFTEKKQALHDLIAETLVLRA